MKSYNQYCSVAVALDKIGDKWTLLIIRELLTGPKRFTDLLDGLPGIPTNLLTERLKRLESDMLVEQETIPPPTPAEVYRLTDIGKGLEEVVLAIVRWGGRWMKTRLHGQAFRPHWLELALGALLPSQPSAPFRARIELPEGAIGITADEGGITYTDIPSNEAGCILRAAAEVILGLAAGVLSWEDTKNRGFVVEGDKKCIDTVKTVLTANRAGAY